MIIIGFLLAFYGQGKSEASQYIMIVGLVLLMAGIYGVSSKLSSRNDDSGS